MRYNITRRTLAAVLLLPMAAAAQSGGQTGSSQTGSSQTGSSQTGSSQTGSSQTGSSQTGSSQTGSSQTGSSQTGSSQTGSSQTGTARWYGARHHGRRTANGEIFDRNGMTAAHRTLPFNTRVRVTNLGNGQSVEVRINDRCRCPNTLIDMSEAAARAIGITGTARVRLDRLPAG